VRKTDVILIDFTEKCLANGSLPPAAPPAAAEADLWC